MPTNSRESSTSSPVSRTLTWQTYSGDLLIVEILARKATASLRILREIVPSANLVHAWEEPKARDQDEKELGEILFAGRADIPGSSGNAGVPWQWALFHRDSYSFRIHRAGNGNLLARLPTVGDIEAHRFQDALLGFFNCLAQTVHTGEIIAICVVLAAFTLDSDPICIKSHSNLMLQEMRQSAQARKQKSPPRLLVTGCLSFVPLTGARFNPGSDLRSHTVTRAVSSAQRGLTSVFGMGTGVTPAIWPPGKSMSSNTKFG